MKWEAGRQGTGYYKLCIWKGKRSDVYLIDYPIGSYIPTHVDKVEGRKHYRINILLCGDDNFIGSAILSMKRMKVFRPDIMVHSVGLNVKRRLVFSIGWAI